MALHINDVYDKLREAQREFDAALEQEDAAQKHTGLRLAYGALSQAASDAYMIYSSRPSSSMFAQGGMSTWARGELEQLTRTMGDQFFREGLVDDARMEREFGKWFDRTKIFVGNLDDDFQMGSSQQKAVDWKEDEIKRKQKQVEEFNKSMMGRDGVLTW